MNAWKCVWKLKYLLMLHFTFIAVTVCYLDQLQILSTAVVYNENNTWKMRHFCCCALTNKSKDKCQRRSKSRCLVCHKPGRNDVESLLYPKKLTIAAVYLIYIANSIFEYYNTCTYVRFSEYKTGYIGTLENLLSYQEYHTYHSTKSDTFTQEMTARWKIEMHIIQNIVIIRTWFL